MKINVNSRDFISHITRVCRSNTKRPCKICVACPFLKYVLQVMDNNGWGYHESLKEVIK